MTLQSFMWLVVALGIAAAGGWTLFRSNKARDTAVNEALRSRANAEASEVAAAAAARMLARTGGWLAWASAYGQAVDAGLNYGTALHAGNDAAVAVWRGEYGSGGATPDDVALWLRELCEQQARRVGGQVVIERGIELVIDHGPPGPGVPGNEVVITDSRALHHQAMRQGGPETWQLLWSTGAAAHPLIQGHPPASVRIRPTEWVAGIDEPAAVGRPNTPPEGVSGIERAAKMVTDAVRQLDERPPVYEGMPEFDDVTVDGLHPAMPPSAPATPAEALASVAAGIAEPWLGLIADEGGELSSAEVAAGFAAAVEAAPAPARRAHYAASEYVEACDKCMLDIQVGEQHVLLGFDDGNDRVHRSCFVAMSPELLMRDRGLGEAVLDLLTAEVALGDAGHVAIPVSRPDDGH